MSEFDHEKLTSHNYDGIQEYDNHTPSWWTWIFLTTIAYAAYYMFIVVINGGELSSTKAYAADYVESLKLQYGQLGDVQPDAATLVRLSHDEKWRSVGRSIFLTNCATCHADDGSGNAGPNLTDDLYIHVRTITDIPDVITNGRKSGAMPAWGQRLLPVERVLVASYVASLRGQNLHSAVNRPAEGEAIAPWPQKAE